MKRIVIDTNVLISFVTSRNSDQQELAAPLFEEAAKARCALICPSNVLTEFAYVLHKIYSVPKNEIATIMKSFIALPGVTIAGDVSYEYLLQVWPAEIPEYGDAVVAAVARTVKGATIATFDKKMAAALERLHMPLHVWERG